jgi:hypothetical protein
VKYPNDSPNNQRYTAKCSATLIGPIIFGPAAVGSLEGCIANCDNYEHGAANCKGFSWDEETQTCTAYSSISAINYSPTDVTTKLTTSAIKVGYELAARIESCPQYEGTKFTDRYNGGSFTTKCGQTFTGTETATINPFAKVDYWYCFRQCAIYQHDENNCVAFTFEDSTNTCTLFKTVNTIEDAASGIYSGIREGYDPEPPTLCPAGPSPKELTYERGTVAISCNSNFKGGSTVFAEIKYYIQNYQECADDCFRSESRSDCVAFTYDPRNEICYLHSGATGETVPNSFDQVVGFLAAPVTVSSTTAGPTATSTEEVLITETGVSTTTASSDDTTTSTATAPSTTTSARSCHNAEPFGFVHEDGWSATVYCNQGFVFPTPMASVPEITDWDACLDLCVGQTGCVGFTYYGNIGSWCDMFDEVSESEEPADPSFYIVSGRVTKPGTGGPVEPTVTSTATAPAPTSTSPPTCLYTGPARLVSEDGWEVTVYCNKAFTSATPWQTVIGSEVPNYNACMMACVDLPGCAGFTYSSGARCDMWSAVSGAEVAIDPSYNFVSGRVTKPKPGFPTTTTTTPAPTLTPEACTETDPYLIEEGVVGGWAVEVQCNYVFEEAAAEPPRVSSVNARGCAEKCVLDTSCLGFLYERIDQMCTFVTYISTGGVKPWDPAKQITVGRVIRWAEQPPSETSTGAPEETATSTSSAPTQTPTLAAELSCVNNRDNGKEFTSESGEVYVVECGIDYTGNNIVSSAQASFEDCMEACSDNDACVNVAFQSGTCYLKSRASENTSKPSVWSATLKDYVQPISCVDNRDNGKELTVRSGATYVVACGIDYTSTTASNLGSTAEATFEDCVSTCAATGGCVNVAYTKGTCYMKKRASEYTEKAAVWSATLKGYVHPPTCVNLKDNGATYPADYGLVYTVECGIDYTGNIGNAPATSFEDCINACGTKTGCIAVAWTSNTCYFKARAVDVESTAKPAVWAAVLKNYVRPLSCVSNKDAGKSYTSDGGNTYAVECGTEYSGGNIANTSVKTASFEECINLCDMTPGCIDVSFTSAKMCYPKSSLGASKVTAGIMTAKRAVVPV